MKKSHLIALMAAGALMSFAGLTACSSSSEVDVVNNPNVEYDHEGNAGVRPEFVISFPRSVVNSKTRMEGDVTQSAGTSAQFRGMDNIRLIPFNEEPKSGSEKFASIMSLTSIQALKKEGTLNYKVYADQFVPVSTKYFLFYGKAINYTAESDITEMDDKFKFGVIKASGLSDDEFFSTKNLSFGLEQINASTDHQAGNSVGRNVVQLMTSLANITSTAGAPHSAWSTTTNLTLSRLYKNFIGTTVSSSNSLSAILGMIYEGLERVAAADPARPLADKIKTTIESVCSSTPVTGSPVSLNSDYAGYPGNIGLPDGAARVRWNGTKFEDMSANYGGGLKGMKLTDYVYPAALWYYISTPLKASSSVESVNYDAQDSWAKVINAVYKGADAEVGGSTQSVALVNPVEYAVGRIETQIKMDDGTFYDGAGNEVAVGDGYTMKGLLFGGQNSVGFDFSTKGSESWTIYDRKLAGNIVAKKNSTSAVNHTLALETKKDKPVFAALELVNGGEAFQGADGIIPAGGTFYLSVELDPKASTTTGYNETVNKIVMKDYVTKVIVKINNGNTTVDRNGDGTPDKYVFDPETGLPVGVDADGNGEEDPYDIDGDGTEDTFVTEPDKGGPGWDTDGDGIVDIPVLPNPSNGQYPDNPNVPEGLGKATNGIPNLTSPGVELGTSVNLEWTPGLTLTPEI